ncbi:hypothetical protein BDF19DRAFT_309663 [Syncephalis fuscata]|nr:hypothetical protein BDF19DRAFT_309663 [Syncephalis fuscata]
MEPKRYDIFELRLKSNRTYRSVYAVEELKSTSPVSQHRQYVVNSCLMGRAGTSVVYGFMDNPNKLDDGAAVARFLDVVRVDLIALPGGLFEYNLPLVRSGQIGIKHFLNFGGPNIASTVISTTRSQAMPANTVMKTKSNKLRFKFINSHADVKIVSSSVLVLGGQCIGEGIRRINLPQEQSVYVADITPIATHPGEGFAACFRFELEEPEVDCDLQVVEIYVYRITSHTLDHPAYAARSLLRTKKSCRNDKHPEEKPANIIPPEEQLSGQNNYRSHELPVEETLDDKKYLTLDEMAMENCYLAYQVYENTELPKTVRASPDDNDVLSQVVIIDLATPKQFMQTVDPLVEGYINDTKRCYVGVHLRANDSDDVVEVIGGIASLASRVR